MIRYDTGTTYNGDVGRASAFSEHDGLNPSVLTAYAMPLAFGGYSIVSESGYGVQDGVPVYGTFDNSSDSIRQIGRLSGDVVLKFTFQCKTVLDTVLVDMAGTQEPAFDATLRGLASDGVSMVEIGTVRAGFPRGVPDAFSERLRVVWRIEVVVRSGWESHASLPQRVVRERLLCLDGFASLQFVEQDVREENPRICVRLP